jgi:hypothetical protein|nr:hypothetical protein [Paraburkholderia sp. BL8N3]
MSALAGQRFDSNAYRSARGSRIRTAGIHRTAMTNAQQDALGHACERP